VAKSKKPTLRESVLALLAELKSPKPKEAEGQTPEAPSVYGLLQLGTDNQAAEAAAPELLVATDSDACPGCGGALNNSIPGVGRRCQACGWQATINQPRGFSRKDYFDGKLSVRSTSTPRKVQLRPPGFARAFGRLVFGGR
jgi:rRNA maturation protein Nop10